MKNNLIFLTLIYLCFSTNIFPQKLSQSNLIKLRIFFYNSTDDKNSLDSLSGFISTLNSNDETDKNPILIAYNGVCNAMYAKYAFFPWNKLKYVNAGMHLLNKAVEIDSSNLEVHFLRFTVLSNLPSFLGYSSKADFEANKIYYMLKSYDTSEDVQLIKNIVQFLIESNRLNKIKQEDLSQYFKLASKQ